MKARRILIGVIATALLFSAGVGLGQTRIGRAENPPASQQGDVVPAAVMDDVVPIQGRLTDSSGNPLNGSYSVTASIYNTASGGAALCYDSDTVSASNGLFNMNMDWCTPSVFDGSQQLYLGIRVGADPEMTPRQAIHGVPLAWGLRQGAIVRGADSVIFVPGTAIAKNRTDDTTILDMQMSGAVQIFRGAMVGAKTVYVPVTLPGVLYGQNVTVKSITVYYKCQTAGNYIDGTNITKQTAADDGYDTILIDYTNRTSTAAASYTLNLTTNNVLSSSQGILGINLNLIFSNGTDYIEIGGVKVVLSH